MNKINLPACETYYNGGPHPGDVWLHVKSRRNYLVLGIAMLEPTATPAVLYRLSEIKDSLVWISDVQDWFAIQENGVPRFVLLTQGHKP